MECPSPSATSSATTPTASKRLRSFRRLGSSNKGESIAGNPVNTIQVLLPEFENQAAESVQAVNDESPQQKVEMARTLRISTSGLCTAQRNQEPEATDNCYLWHSYSDKDQIHCSNSIKCGLLDWANDSTFIRPFLSKFITEPPKRLTPPKRIAVSEDVLSNYHESFLYGDLTFSTRVRASIRGPLLSTLLLLLECVAALLMLVFYIRKTYSVHRLYPITVIRVSCSSFFLLDYLIKIYSAPVRLYYVLSFNGIVDFISTLPVFCVFISGQLANAAIPQVFLVLRILRAAPLLASWILPGGAISQEIFVLIAYCLGVFVLAAGVLQWVEFRATSHSSGDLRGCPSRGCLSFYDAFYFIIVTISTVGYGDITIKSEWGRFIVILIIIAAIVFIPVEINKILEIASRRPYGGKYDVRKVIGSRLIIVSGNLTYRAIEDFLFEFYHPSHAKDMRAFPLRMIIMAPFKPSFEMKVLLTQYKGRVEFVEGTPLKDSDLERVSANIASAFFLMADHLTPDPDAEDAAQIMRALSVHRYCGSKVRLIVEMLKPENQDNPIWDDADGGIEIVCPEAICYQILARSCQIKGISTLIVNLFKSGLKVCKPIPGDWMEQYSHGQQHQIYPVILPSCFYEHELAFDEAVEIVYLNFGIILFGLDILVDDDVREVVLFPKTRVIKRTDIGLVIAEDLYLAEKVSKYPEENLPARCFKLCRECPEQDDSLIHSAKKKRHSTFRLYSDTDSSAAAERKERQKEGSRSSSFGMMSLGRKPDLQTQLQEIICVSAMHESGSSNQDGFRKSEAKVYSLQEAVELITQWPPLKPEKPDHPVLYKRSDLIRKNLEERTVTVVNLNQPHILVCMQGKWPINVFYFVAHLRNPYLPNPPIVIMHPEVPSTAHWGCVGMFKEVYFLQGSPVHEVDLLRAGVLQAEKVVVLAPRGSIDGLKDVAADDSRLAPSSVIMDMDNVLIAATVERLLHPVQGRMIVELLKETEIQFLRPKLRMNPRRFDPVLYDRNRSGAFVFSPSYVEGKGFCSASLTFLLYTLFFNRNTVAITEKLISGGEVVVTSEGENVVGARLEQKPLPKKFVGQTFGKLLQSILYEQGWLVLGLYRTGVGKSTISYVYTNPPNQEILLRDDLMYVLC